MPSAFTHDPQITVPASSTDNAVVIFDGTAGTGFGNSTIIVDSGGNGRIGIAADTNVITLTSGSSNHSWYCGCDHTYWCWGRNNCISCC